jgi:hypothetical protein
MKTYFKEKKMRRVFICYVMILSLLLAIVGCSDGNFSDQKQDYENMEESDETEQEVPEPEGSEPEDPELENPEPVPIEPVPIEPVPIEPAPIEPSPIEPAPIEPAPIEPAPIEPTPIEPAPIEPTPIEPTPIEPVPIEPVPIEPTPIEPTPIDRTPKMLINELRTEYDSSKKRTEFVEFKVKSAGNLEGVKLFIKWDAKKPFEYSFPAIEVKAGEYITLHLRTLEDKCIDELGSNLSQSEGTDSVPTARDLWIPGNKKLLHKTDIVYLQNASGGIMDAIVMNEKPEKTWPTARQHFVDLTEFLFNKGAWKSVNGKLPDPLDSVDTSAIKTAATRSVSRYEEREDTNTANDWYATGNGGATPGLPN